MTNRTKTQQMDGGENEVEESLIELTEVAESAPDDEVIELTDVFNAPEGEDDGIIELTEVAAEAPAGEEGIIDLTEPVAEPEPMAEEDILDLTEPLTPAEEGTDAPIEVADVVPQAPEEGVLELADVAAEPEALPESGMENLDLSETLFAEAQDGETIHETAAVDAAESPEISAVGDDDVLAASAASEESQESDLLDFGDLELGDGESETDSETGAEAPETDGILDLTGLTPGQSGEDEETLALGDEALLDLSDAAGGEDENSSETEGLLDLESLSEPQDETSLEEDGLSDIFDDLTSGDSPDEAPAAENLPGETHLADVEAAQPSAAEDLEGLEDTDTEIEAMADETEEPALTPESMAEPPAESTPEKYETSATANAPEKPKAWDMGEMEEKFILGAGGIRMGEKEKNRAQAVAGAAEETVSEAVAPVGTASPAMENPQEGTAALTVSPEQVEAAVERVVRRMFSDKIESMLLEVLEKAVLKEIQRIKETLLDATSENDAL